MHFPEFQKPMILNKTNIRRFSRIFKTRDTSQWRCQVVLYVDESIEYAGKVVGGLRIRPTQVNRETPAPQPMANGRYEEPDSEYF